MASLHTLTFYAFNKTGQVELRNESKVDKEETNKEQCGGSGVRWCCGV